jgi:protein-tyrosine kinase
MEHIQAAIQKAKQRRIEDPLDEPTALPTSLFGTEATWSALKPLDLDPKLLARNRIVTASRIDPAHTQFDRLRTNLLQLIRQNNWTSIAITSPTAGCGKTLVSLNLALSLANQPDCRTVLVDLDLRRPQVAHSLGLRQPPPIEEFLHGNLELQDAFLRYGENVAIAGNLKPVKFAAELLQSAEVGRVLKGLRNKLKPNVILFDMPPMLANDDVAAFLPNVDCAILVVAAEATTTREAELCERELAEKTNLLGVVLNKCRFAPDKYGY